MQKHHNADHFKMIHLKKNFFYEHFVTKKTLHLENIALLTVCISQALQAGGRLNWQVKFKWEEPLNLQL